MTDVDRAKAFYVEQVGFHADHDYQVTDALPSLAFGYKPECPDLLVPG